MYSQVKSVQYLVALMKAHNVKHVVLSPGGRNIPINHSLEQDDFFTCYSVVDERSAAYFALGLSRQLGNEIVAVCCTSSVAASNYLPAITEAYYLNVPLLVLTADRHPHMLGQRENQMIDQVNMYQNFCKKCVNLPYTETPSDLWACQRMINEAILEVKHHGCGPVQINIPIAGSIGLFTEPKLPAVKVINRLEYGRTPQKWNAMAEKLAKAQKILVVCGERVPPTLAEKELIEEFARKYNCVVATEHVSNVNCEGSLDLFGAAQVMPLDTFTDFVPDIVISLGGNFVSRLKDLLRAKPAKSEHWLIDEGGNVCDLFKSLRCIYECTPIDFFRFFVNKAPEGIKNNRNYYNMWKDYADRAVYPEFPFSNSYAIKGLSTKLPDNAILHLGILNATRIMQHCPIPAGITAYSNIGAFGIDGSMSTFMGQAAAAPDKPAFLVIGDLSFFYDMNALQMRHISKNVRIMLVNNSGAAEFHLFMGEKVIPTLNRHIAAEHSTSAKGWVESRNFRYYSARTAEEFDSVLDAFIDPKADRPAVLEVFTDKKADAEMLKEYYNKFKTKKSI